MIDRRAGRLLLGAASITILAACGGNGPRREAMGPLGAIDEKPTFTLTTADIESVVSGVSAGRQLPVTRPVSIERLGPKAFFDRYIQGRTPTQAATSLTAESAFLIGFDFLPEPSKRTALPTIEAVLKEQVVGFYDRMADKVFVPELVLTSEDELLRQRAVLAHEVHHALQARHFPALPKPKNSDEDIAALSLIEGDAMVAMGAWIGSEAGAPVSRTLRRLVEVTRRVPLAVVAKSNDHPTLNKAIALTRKRLEFPYEEGMMLVSDVYRAGGFPLVDKMYGHYPRSTAQVIHPDKYLAGDLPQPVRDPSPPEGFAVASVDTLGELDTRTLLERCLDPSAAAAVAAGWAGDRFGVFSGPEHRLAVAWISAWDTESDAEEMAGALEKSAGCWHDNALGVANGDYAIGKDFRVQRHDKLVAFLRGVPEGAQARMTKHLFSLVGPKPKATALTDLRIPPRVHLPEPVPGHLQGDVYENAWLGLVGRVPAGMTATTGGHVEFAVQREDAAVHGGMVVSTRITSDEQNEKTFHEVERAFADEVGKFSLAVQNVGGQAVQTSLGNGLERTFRAVGTMVEVRAVLIPICAGTGSVVFMEAYGDPFARSVLDGWMGSFRWMNGRNLKACDFLDPK